VFFFNGIYRFVLGFSMGFYQHMEKRWNKHALPPTHGNYDWNWNIMDFTPTKIPWEGDLHSGGLCNISHKWMQKKTGIEFSRKKWGHLAPQM